MRVAAFGPQLPRWPDMYRTLRDSGMRSIPAESVKGLVDSGKWVSGDVVWWN